MSHKESELFELAVFLLASPEAPASYPDLEDILIEASVKPELIIADFRLRDKQNGIDAIELMREEFNQNIPAILATGDTAPDRVREANSADVEVLYKPIDADELRITIFEVLSNN